MRNLAIAIAVCAISACQTIEPPKPTTTNPAEQEQLYRVWGNTLIILPQEADRYIYRGRNLDIVERKFGPDQKYPAVVFLHGSTGLFTGSTQVTRMAHAMAAAGYVVFAPDSLARPVPPYADAKTFKSRIGYAEVQDRIAEARMVYERVRHFTWIDADNIFIAGHSMGGMSVQNVSSGEFRGYVILGYHCSTHTDRRLEGLKIPKDKPVLAIRGDADEWFASGPNRAAHCGQYARGYRDAESVILKGIPHDISQDPTAMPKVVEFLRRNMLGSP